MQDLKSEEKVSNVGPLLLIVVLLGLGGVGGYFLTPSTKPDNTLCAQVCADNTSLLIKELHKKNYLKTEIAVRLLDGFSAKCQLDCKNNKASE